MKKIVFTLSILALLMVSSCSSYTPTVLPKPLSNCSIGDRCNLHVTIFQALNSKEALAKQSSIVVKLITNEDTFYDGKVVSGQYIMVDTYTYKHNLDGKNDSKEYIKTVPVFIKESEYKKNNP